jgi:hypothetical protein
MAKQTLIQTPAGQMPVSFGMAALASFLDSEGLKLADLSDLTLTQALKLVWQGFADGARRGGTPFPHTFETVCDWIDDRPEVLNEALAVFSNSMPQEPPGNAQPAHKAKVRR